MATTSAAAKQLSDGNSQGTVLGQSATDLIGFYGITTGAAQLTPAGNTATGAAGATTAVFVNTTFTGGTGSTAFTVGDIVLALKQTGFLKA